MRVGVLASGEGTNLQALLDTVHGGAVEIVAVASDQPGARALERADGAGVATRVFERGAFADRPARDAAVADWLEERDVGLVVLAGYMAILDDAFLTRYAGRIVNVHPSLLPAFPGLHPHRQALGHGVKVAGATVHFVDEGTDTGPIVLQAAVPVRPDDTETTLSERILAEEHRLYPEAVRLFAEGRLEIRGRQVHIRESS